MIAPPSASSIVTPSSSSSPSLSSSSSPSSSPDIPSPSPPPLDRRRSLAYTATVLSTTPIPKASSVQLARVLGWECIVPLSVKAGDRGVYFEIDSILPSDGDCYSWIHCLHRPTTLIKSMKLLGCLSQGLFLEEAAWKKEEGKKYLDWGDKLFEKDGVDLTDRLGVRQRTDTMDKGENNNSAEGEEEEKRGGGGGGNKILKGAKISLSSAMRAPYLSKTDEDRLQTFIFLLERLKGRSAYITEKIDGTSITFGIVSPALLKSNDNNNNNNNNNININESNHSKDSSHPLPSTTSISVNSSTDPSSLSPPLSDPSIITTTPTMIRQSSNEERKEEMEANTKDELKSISPSPSPSLSPPPSSSVPASSSSLSSPLSPPPTLSIYSPSSNEYLGELIVCSRNQQVLFSGLPTTNHNNNRSTLPPSTSSSSSTSSSASPSSSLSPPIPLYLPHPRTKGGSADNYYYTAKEFIATKLMSIIPHHHLSDYIFQGELFGENIQKNLLEIKGQKIKLFSIWHRETKKKLSFDEMKELLKNDKKLIEELLVPIVEIIDNFNYSLEDLLKLSQGKYAKTKNDREGIVIRSIDQTISFKVINNQYLLKHGQ